MGKWISVEEGLPEKQSVIRSRRRYMAYSPMYGGYIFRCWYSDGFGAVYAQSMIDGVTHYKIAGKSEVDRQIEDSELIEIRGSKEEQCQAK